MESDGVNRSMCTYFFCVVLGELSTKFFLLNSLFGGIKVGPHPATGHTRDAHGLCCEAQHGIPHGPGSDTVACLTPRAHRPVGYLFARAHTPAMYLSPTCP